MDAGPDYQILLRPTPGVVPPTVRLRRFLKSALRAYGLRCLEAREVPAKLHRPPSRAAHKPRSLRGRAISV